MLMINVFNISELAPVSDYKYEVSVGFQVLARGILKGHTRSDGWAILVKKIAEQHIATTEISRDGRVIGTQQSTVAELPEAPKAAVVACGFLRERDMAICVKPSGHTSAKYAKDRAHKFSRIVAEPARPRR